MKLETMQINPGTYTDVVTGTTNASANKDVTITSANEDYLVVDSDGYAYVKLQDTFCCMLIQNMIIQRLHLQILHRQNWQQVR